MTKLALATENAALRASVSQLSTDLLNANAHILRLRIICANRTPKPKRTYGEAAELARHLGGTVQSHMYA
jgi:hypothetical protein